MRKLYGCPREAASRSVAGTGKRRTFPALTRISHETGRNADRAPSRRMEHCSVFSGTEQCSILRGEKCGPSCSCNVRWTLRRSGVVHACVKPIAGPDRVCRSHGRASFSGRAAAGQRASNSSAQAQRASHPSTSEDLCGEVAVSTASCAAALGRTAPAVASSGLVTAAGGSAAGCSAAGCYRPPEVPPRLPGSSTARPCARVVLR